MCVSFMLFAVGLKVGVTVLTPVLCPSASTVTTGSNNYNSSSSRSNFSNRIS